MKKILKISALIILIILLLGCSVEAVDLNMGVAKNFANHGKSSLINMQGLYYVVNTLYGIVMTIAIAIALVRGAMIAFTIITGSLEEKVDAKKMIINYVFLVAILAVGPAILQVIMKMMKSKLV